MNFSTPDLIPVVPEMFVAGMACLILVIDLFLNERSRVVSYWLTLGTLAGAAILTARLFGGDDVSTFGGMFIGDSLANALKLIMYVVVAVSFLYSREYLKDRDLFKGEYYVLGLFGLVGMMVMVSAHHFLPIYLGLELLSLSLYAMVAFDRESAVASESAMKYFVLGAIASGMLLYGMSIFYGMTGALSIEGVQAYIATNGGDSLGFIFALSFVLVGLAFKLGAVPFHMWIPDVYHGAPTPVTLYVGAAPKLAAFALFIRLLVEGLGGLSGAWQDMLIVLSLGSMGVGSILAIAQTNIKRMLAYSTITHVGFILLGLVAADTIGYQAAMFYAIVYVIMATGAFGMIILLSHKGFESDQLADFRGLNDRSPWFAAMMAILMFGMAGVPPLAGFHAKLGVLRAVINADLAWLAVPAILFAVISAFYYLRVVKHMYFDSAGDLPGASGGFDLKLVLSANSLVVLVLGAFPGVLLDLCWKALQAF